MRTGTNKTSDSYAMPPFGEKDICDYCGQKKVVYGHVIKYTENGKTESKKICKDCLDQKKL